MQELPQGHFTMPMFKNWVPERLRPWLYVLLAFTFQVSGGVYLGGLEEMMGSMSLMREDILMCFYSSLCGLAFTFPILFRTKFRFTNRSLLLFSALGITACNLATLYVDSLPLLWIICFISGCLKIQGTFECMSNIQLWMTPKRDFAVFFPMLHLWIMISIAVSDLLAVYFCHILTWRYMIYFMSGIMLVNVLWIFICTRHFRFMKPMPLYAVDWLGAFLWALSFMQAVYVLCYGEYYNWFDSPVIKTLILTDALTFALAITRMFIVRHPYIQPNMWRNRRLPAIFFLAFAIEAFFAAEHVLEEVFYESIEGWHSHTSAVLNYPYITGVICGALFALVWLKVWRFGRVRLIAIGISVFTVYAIFFYFNIDSSLNIQKLYLPVFMRSCSATILGAVLLYTIQSSMNFMVFFQGLAIFQVLHLLVGGVAGAAFHSYGIRYFMADNISRHAAWADCTALSMTEIMRYMDKIMVELQTACIKQLYGIVIYATLVLLAAVLIYDIPFTREYLHRMPSWISVGKKLARRL